MARFGKRIRRIPNVQPVRTPALKPPVRTPASKPAVREEVQ